MKPTTWILVFFSIVGSFFASVATFNWWADPMSIYNPEETPLIHRYEYDERLQKTIAVKFAKQKYDAILLGSSVSTYLNQNHFKHNRLYNYALSAMRPEEFPGYLSYFKTENEDDVSTVYLGADFLLYFNNDSQHLPPATYIDKVSKPGFRLRELLSMSQVNLTLQSIEFMRKGVVRKYYKPGNVASIVKPTDHALEQRILEGLQADNFENLVVDGDYESHLDSTIAAAEESRFIVFTTPVSHFRINLFFERGKFSEYGEWLRLLIRKFGKIYHFADINSITSNHKKYYYDSYHFYPEVGDMIIKYIESEGELKFEDFGIILTHGNIDEYLQKLTKNLKQ